MSEQEMIARIIAPDAFLTPEERLSGHVEWMTRTNQSDPERQKQAEKLAQENYLHDSLEREAALAKAAAILTTLEASRTPGMVMVPREPTEAMIDEVADLVRSNVPRGLLKSRMARALAASPTPSPEGAE